MDYSDSQNYISIFKDKLLNQGKPSVIAYSLTGSELGRSPVSTDIRRICQVIESIHSHGPDAIAQEC